MNFIGLIFSSTNQMSFSFQIQQNELSWGPNENRTKIPRDDYPEITFSPFSNEEYIGRSKKKKKKINIFLF